MTPKPTTPVVQPGAAAQGSPKNTDVWDCVAAMDEFKLLLLAKTEFVVPAVVTFVVYYFALPISVGYFPEFMDKKVLGPVNIAYLFALSQFFVAWLIAALYVRRARVFDEFGTRIMQRVDKECK